MTRRRQSTPSIGYTTAQECIGLLTATYPNGQLLPRHRYIAEEVATRAQARRDAPTTNPAKRRPEPTTDDGFHPFQDPWQHRPGPDTHGPGRSL